MVYPYQQQQYPYQRINQLRIFPVSNIMEANATPVDGFEPVFFYNRAENVIYKKQLNQLGSAPIQIFKLEQLEQSLSDENNKKDINIYADNFKVINERLDGLYKLLRPIEVEEDKKGKR